jgi:hypothetical protein
MNPTLSPKLVERALAEDSTAAAVEFCVQPGLFREDLESFISRAEVECLVIRGRKELAPQSSQSYFAGVDMSGGKHDPAALAIVHREDRGQSSEPVFVLDCLETFKSPHSPYDIVARMCETLKRYRIKTVSADSYAAEWVKQEFHRHGFLCERASATVWNEADSKSTETKVRKTTSDLFLELLPKLHSGQIELLDNDQLVTQLAALQRRTRSGAKDQVSHPPGGHDDACAALAQAINAAANRKRKFWMRWMGVSTEDDRKWGAAETITPEERQIQKQIDSGSLRL